MFVVDHEAMSWHLGRSQVLRRADQVNRYNDPYLANLVPAMRPKRNRHGRAYEVPYLEVVVPLGPGRRDRARRRRRCSTRRCPTCAWSSWAPGTTCTRTASSRSRTRCWRPGSCTAPTAASRACGWSRRPPEATDAEFRLTLPGVAFAPPYDAMGALLDDLERTHHGARVITFPTAPPHG